MAQGPFRRANKTIEAKTFDPFHFAQTQIDEEHRLIHDGMVYVAFDDQAALGAGLSYKYHFRTGSIPAHWKRSKLTVSSGPATLKGFEAPTGITGGAALSNINLNRISANTAGAVVTGGVSTTDDGSPFLGGFLIPDGGFFGGGQGGDTALVSEYVLAPNSDYLIVVTNDNGVAIDFSISMVFYDIDYS